VLGRWSDPGGDAEGEAELGIPSFPFAFEPRDGRGREAAAKEGGRRGPTLACIVSAVVSFPERGFSALVVLVTALVAPFWARLPR
jgi:hypothetical protein